MIKDFIDLFIMLCDKIKSCFVKLFIYFEEKNRSIHDKNSMKEISNLHTSDSSYQKSLCYIEKRMNRKIFSIFRTEEKSSDLYSKFTDLQVAVIKAEQYDLLMSMVDEINSIPQFNGKRINKDRVSRELAFIEMIFDEFKEGKRL